MDFPRQMLVSLTAMIKECTNKLDLAHLQIYRESVPENAYWTILGGGKKF